MRNGKPTLTALAAALGISKAQASKCAARGMPTHDLEAAHKWRLTHLHWKAKTDRPPPPPPDPVALALREVVPLMFFSPETFAAVAADTGIVLTPEQARTLTAHLLCVYMAQVDDLLGAEAPFRVQPELLTK
jgi:hypothetical protein